VAFKNLLLGDANMTQPELAPIDVTRGEYRISTDRALLDVDLIHRFLADQSYWARGIERALVVRSLEHSLCFGLYRADALIGFARVVTDYATFAFLSDVFVLPADRGRGLARWLLEVVQAHPGLQGLRRWMLVTKDAHGLYRKLGWSNPLHPERLMEISAGAKPTD